MWRAALATLPVLVVTAYLFIESRHSDHHLLEAETARQADNTFLQLQAFATTHLGILQDAGDFVVTTPALVAEETFVPFVKRLVLEKTDFYSVVWKQMDGTVHEIAPLQSGPDDFPGPPPALLDVAEARARATRRPVATASFSLAPGVEATTMVVPLFDGDQFVGTLEGMIRLTEGMHQLFGRDVLDFWNIEIYDRTGRCAYQALVGGSQTPKPVASLVAERHVPVADRAWKVRLWPTPLLISTLRTGASWRILGIGLVATALLALANFLLGQHQARLAEALLESERLAADVEATRQHLSDLVNGIEAAIWESDAGMKHFTFVNDYARKLLQIRPEAWVSTPTFWYEHVHPDDREIALQNVQSAEKPGWTYPVEYRMLTPDKSVLWVQEIITVIGQGKRVFGRRGVVVDITARIQAEEALRQSQKLESLGVLAGGIAHDFNNLLTTIIGNAEMLGNSLGTSDAPARQHLDKIERTTRRLAELTRQMLAYSGRSQFRVGQVDLNTIIREMTDLLSVSTPKNVKVTYRLAPDLPLMEGDSSQIRQVLLNLLTNATEAIGELSDGVVLVRTDAVSLDAVEIQELYAEQALEPGRFIRLEVSDNGSGMSEETLSKIFDPFFTTKFTGRGLGLAALRGIVRGHDGGIRILSQPGEGTVFSLVFPARGALALLPAMPTVPARKASSIDGTHVLVVDDEEGLRSVMVSALESAGCTVYEAADGEQGVEQFERHRDDIDVVVLDLTMPKLNGDEVFRRIRASQPDVRVIMCSGYTEEDIIRHFDGHTLAGFIEKPFKPSELIQKIAVVLGDGCTTSAKGIACSMATEQRTYNNGRNSPDRRG